MLYLLFCVIIKTLLFRSGLQLVLKLEVSLYSEGDGPLLDVKYRWTEVPSLTLLHCKERTGS